jgi:carbonic anhydrase
VPKGKINAAKRIRDCGLADKRGRIFAALSSGICFCLLLIGARTRVWAQHPDSAIPADQALARLMEGNARYARNKERHPDETLAWRRELQAAQHPFAVILSCSDSRVPPELIFDQGLGDLFVIRVAGNIIGDDELASIEYAVQHLHTNLIMVLGHEKCGAVTAAVQGETEPGHLKFVVSAIQPSVEEIRDFPGDKLHNCVLANARRVALQIRESEPVLRELVEKRSAKVAAADYTLDSGKVTLLKNAQPRN